MWATDKVWPIYGWCVHTEHSKRPRGKAKKKFDVGIKNQFALKILFYSHVEDTRISLSNKLAFKAHGECSIKMSLKCYGNT